MLFSRSETEQISLASLPINAHVVLRQCWCVTADILFHAVRARSRSLSSSSSNKPELNASHTCVTADTLFHAVRARSRSLSSSSSNKPELNASHACVTADTVPCSKSSFTFLEFQLLQ
ncbi:hypothetical protein BaRGS_00014426 [Batillaria attramentaria]|uniref:Uncharacterized protein n=1 Tax=Batillaria attramentaria TaxID=370345 RepID=A0ABD0L4V1_9CAEN